MRSLDGVTEGFWLNHHLRNPLTNEIYCYVAKVGCSFIKTGFLVDYFSERGDIVDPHLIRDKVHRRVVEFRVRNIAEIETAKARILIVRDPWQRLVSAFLDKFVRVSGGVSFAQKVSKELGKQTHQITMADFTSYLASTRTALLNEHWVPQAAHKVPTAGYDIVSLDQIEKNSITARWAKAAGPVYRHSLGERLYLPSASYRTASEIKAIFNEAGKWPSASSFEVPPDAQFQDRFLTTDSVLLGKRG